MKKIYTAVAGFLLAATTMAQVSIDRTQQPKAGPAPVIDFPAPAMYKLQNGITVLVVENHKLPKITASYFIDYGPVTEGAKAGEMGMMGQMLSEGTTNMDKAKFDEAVDQIGADVNLNSSGGSASALTRYFDKSFMLMSDALLHPSFPQESFDKIKSQVLTGLKSDEKNAQAISARVVNALAYGPEHPNGEFETEETINNITLDDVKKIYQQYITPSRGYLTFVGDIKPEQAKALAEEAFANWQGNKLGMPDLKNVSNPGKTEIDLVDLPNAVQSEITVVNLVNLPMSSPDYFAVSLANQILGGSSDARLFMDLRERHGFTYGSYSGIGSGRFQSTFSATASVRNEKTDSAVAEILKQIDTIRTEKVSEEELKNAKALYNGSFALQMENPARTATFARNILINNLPEDFYRTYLQKINAVTADDVQQAAQKYFNHDNTRVVVVGKAEQVKAGLENLDYDLNSYNKYAEPLKNTGDSMAANVNAGDIINKYIAAIGGADEVKKVNSVAMAGNMSMQGATLDVTEKMMAPNMEMMEMVMNGQPVMHTAFNGTTGYQSQMGNKQDLSDDQLATYKENKGIVPQLYYQTGNYTLEVQGTEKVDNSDAYKIKVTSPGGKISTEYYDVSTGFLVKEDKTMNVNGQEIQQSVEHSNYKKVGSVSFPFTNELSVQTAAGSQDFTIEFKDIKVNDGVSEEDFN